MPAERSLGRSAAICALYTPLVCEGDPPGARSQRRSSVEGEKCAWNHTSRKDSAGVPGVPAPLEGTQERGRKRASAAAGVQDTARGWRDAEPGVFAALLLVVWGWRANALLSR